MTLESEKTTTCFECREWGVHVRTHTHLRDVRVGEAWVVCPDDETIGIVRQRDGIWVAWTFGNYPDHRYSEVGIAGSRAGAVQLVATHWADAEDAVWRAIEARKATA